jgi:hypothetical protein
VSFGSDEMAERFAANSVRADAYFERRTVILNGRVKAITPDFVLTGTDGVPIRLVFSDDDALQIYNTGGRVNARCEYSGFSRGIVRLGECAPQPMGR